MVKHGDMLDAAVLYAEICEESRIEVFFAKKVGDMWGDRAGALVN